MELIGTLNFDYGYIEVNLIQPEANVEYILYRGNYPEHERFSPVAVLNELNNFTYIDNTIEQGEIYVYTITQKDGAAIQTIINSDFIISDFEDIILTDKNNRSLRVRFNPKISALKNITQEQKIETIGNKYPFFFRNGQLKYREIPLSGLIQMEMDSWFYPADDIGDLNVLRSVTPSRSVGGRTSREDYYNERKFKLEVEKWLTNGEPKIMRSPTEGNFLVKLINISLSPEDQLARKLHSFSATAYEIGEYTIKDLYENGFIHLGGDVEYEEIGSVAGLGKYGRVVSSTKYNYISILSDQTCELNEFDVSRIMGSDEDIEIIFGGDYYEETPAGRMFRMTRSSTAPIPPATNENAGFVQSTEGRNHIAIDADSGAMRISDKGIGIEIVSANIGCIGGVDTDVLNEIVTVIDEGSHATTLLSVAGDVEGTKNKLQINKGTMTVSSVGPEKILWTKELIIGGE